MNTPKTAMGELMEMFNDIEDDFEFCEWLDENKERLLEKEKQMVINIVNHCYKIERQKGFVPDGESYYNQTFKNDKS